MITGGALRCDTARRIALAPIDTGWYCTVDMTDVGQDPEARRRALLADAASSMENMADRAGTPVGAIDLETTDSNPETCTPIQIGLWVAVPRLEPDVMTPPDRHLRIRDLMRGQARSSRAWGTVTLLQGGVAVPEGATRVNGITTAMLVGAPPLRGVFSWLGKVLAELEWVIAFNGSRYDLPVIAATARRLGLTDLEREARRLGRRVIDPLAIHRRAEPATLEALYTRFVDPAGLEGKHDALIDISGTVRLLEAQWARGYAGSWDEAAKATSYGNTHLDAGRKLKLLTKGVAALAEGKPIPATEIVIDFGEHRGKNLIEMRVLPDARNGQPGGYLRWIMSKDFPMDVKAPIAAVLGGANEVTV